MARVTVKSVREFVKGSPCSMLCDRGDLPGWSRSCGSLGVAKQLVDSDCRTLWGLALSAQPWAMQLINEHNPGLVGNHSPPSTMTTFHVYLLHEHQHASYEHLESYQVEAPDEGSTRPLRQTALEHIKSRRLLNLVKPLETAKFEIYQVRWLRGLRIPQNLTSCFAVLGTPSGGVRGGEGDSGN